MEEKKDLEEYFEDMEKTFCKEHPILHKIDLLFTKKGVTRIADYRPSYAITHPWVMVKYSAKEIKYAWQRAFRGWDETVTWGLDFYLARMIPVWVEELKSHKDGVPCEFMDESNDLEKAQKEWDLILDKIVSGFKSYAIMEDEMGIDTPKYLEAKKNFDEGFELFKKYFGSLWW